MAKRKKTKFIVALEMPPEASVTAMRNYIRDAVKSMCGSFHPSDPIFDLNRNSISVKRLYQERKKS